MNNKGMTIIEVIVSFVLISLIITSLITISLKYHEKVEKERMKTELVDYKNTLTKIIYDDIIKDKYTKIEYCLNNKKCVNFIEKNGIKHELSYQNQAIFYDNNQYNLPDKCIINSDFELKSSLDIYHLVIVIKNEIIKEEEKVLLTIN